MPQGLQVFDPTATHVLVDVTTYVGSFVGSFSTGGAASGTHTDSRMVGRDLVHFIPDTGDSNGYGGPVVTLNATTGAISWAYTYVDDGFPAPPIPNETIYYGGY
jgi:hypothetical protein